LNSFLNELRHPGLVGREAGVILKQGSIKALISLIEVKLRCLTIIDREDKRERRLLESCRDELGKMLLRSAPGATAPEATEARLP
jgi:hypothetical protein